MSRTDSVREHLLVSNDEFRHLAEQHAQLDRRLDELSRQLYRSGNDEQERATIKKRKLQLKDRMEAMLRSYRAAARMGAPPESALQPEVGG